MFTSNCLRHRGPHADADLNGTEDPEPYFGGCVEPQKNYPTKTFLLSYPVQCKNTGDHGRAAPPN